MKDGTGDDDFKMDAKTYDFLLRDARLEGVVTWRHEFQAKAYELLATSNEAKLSREVRSLGEFLLKWGTDLEKRLGRIPPSIEQPLTPL